MFQNDRENLELDIDLSLRLGRVQEKRRKTTFNVAFNGKKHSENDHPSICSGQPFLS